MSVAAPSPTMRPMTSSPSGSAPDAASTALAESVRSRRESTSVPSRSKTMRRVLTWLLSASVFGERCWRLPHLHADDREFLRAGIVEDQARDALDRRIAVEEIHRLTELLQRLDERIVVAQQHLVVERRIDPAFHDTLDVAEIADHIAVVELAGAHFDFRHGVVSVRVLANTVVIEQPVPVTEVDALGHGVHLVIG